MLADAECIYTAVDYLRSVGLTPADVVARISSRSLLAALLTDIGFAPDQLDPLYALLDKRPKLPPETFEALVAEQVPDTALRDKLMQLQAVASLDELTTLAGSPAAQTALAQLQQVFSYLTTMGIADYCTFDIGIVRGLAYYTGCVFEIFDRSSKLRAVAAGGRYDNLLAGLGGQAISGTGFGMGDVVLALLLEEKNLLGSAKNQLDFFIITADAELFDQALSITCQLRAAGYATALDYRTSASIPKQLKQATAGNARAAVILGEETIQNQQITLKNLADGSQRPIPLDQFLAQPQQPEQTNA